MKNNLCDYWVIQKAGVYFMVSSRVFFHININFHFSRKKCWAKGFEEQFIFKKKKKEFWPKEKKCFLI